MRKNYLPGMPHALRCVLFLFNLALIHHAAAQTLPAGFSRVKVASLDQGTAMAFAPDGRLFVCQKDGRVRIIKNGTLLGTPFLTLTVAQDGERGISGICFDPNFATNKYIYIYYTATTPTIHNRLSRFTANGDLVLGGSELVLLDFETVNTVYHNGGGMGFGKDGKLYLSMGEDNSPNNAQNLGTHKGKLLRLNSDGTTPTDNPYYSSANPITRRIWCLGLRNPYTLNIHPTSGKIYINNVGADSYEEVHDGTAPGQNFGWPVVEGYSSNAAYANPVFAYPHESTGQHGCCIAGGCFFNPASTTYPAQYIGKYFYQDFCNGWMYYFTPGTQASGNTFFGSGLVTQNLALQVGPDGNLYYINRYNTSAGIWKIIYTNNNAPAITNHPVSQTVTAGQPVTFSVSASGATPFTYQWRKNGTNISGANASSYSIASTVQADSGLYSCVVSNSYGSATSNNAKLTVKPFNAQPTATILTPVAGTMFRAGDTIFFSGNATDPEDGVLPASAYTWEVEIHHNNNHSHPGPVIPPGVKTGSFVISRTDHTDAAIFYRIILSVKDSKGLIDTTHVDLHPHTSRLTFTSDPSGLQILYASQPKATTFTTLTVEGNLITIDAASPQFFNNKYYVFDHWEHTSARSNVIEVGMGDSAYKAYFKDTVINCSAEGKILREYWANVSGGSVGSIPLNTPPTSISFPTLLEAPSNIGDNYGTRMRGYVCAPLTGNYVFYIASDNNSELWLSTNDNPANKQKIAYVTGYTGWRVWNKYVSQQSAPVALTAGGKYYIEVLHKESTGGDNVSVGWQLPGGALERPIPGTRISPFPQGGGGPSNELISANGTWRYLANGSNQGTAWRALSFHDETWSTGNAELGYGDGDEATVVSYGPSSGNKYITTYFRKVFDVSDASAFTGLELNLIRDDGAVVYINGIEVYRNNMPSGSIAYNTLAPNYIDGASESAWVTANLNNVLVNGTNLIAVEIHQNSPSSSDISFNLKLKGVNTSLDPQFVAPNASWKYLDNGTDQGMGWRATSFDDSGWKTGNAELGYGDGGEATVVSYGPSSTNKYVTTYFRKTFSTGNASSFGNLELNVIRDDGVIVYINGNEVFRNNLPGGAVNFTTLASTYVDGVNESSYIAAYIPNTLVNGTNVIAAEIHQNSRSSSDISFNLKLKGTNSAKPDDVAMLTEVNEGTEPRAEILVYPNPNSGKFTLEFQLDSVGAKDVVVDILNSAGQKVYTKTLVQANGYIREVIELDQSLASGVYFMNVITDGVVETKRIVLKK
jgi:glucose/arabinose dehydrogenase